MNYKLGQKSSLLSVHKALIGALNDDNDGPSRLNRRADKLLPYDFVVEHLTRKEMVFEDYLCRHPSGETFTPFI